ncbi:Glycosyltransferase sugar-binding region containing DXD motif protein [Rubripirellula lacrimiformis]|uniref:Glycosyltransferase sugar-binding region containing DXD motif protein n=1 Tax=Rubripirellula lacrimiformis TaxID=1930273 RepID=A0A517NJJ6_9BACT|nr:glycosyltransferase [Rubripirellula lacrimiformis]QDT07304.1 Glycosyltransferase sugar-binding region containing DXD motif protein [Rubripirellula lacrimiformis]
MSIPKILHQTWKDDNVPEHFAECVQSWKTHHPDWQYRLWTDQDNRQLIADRYHWFLETYDRYPKAIQRADAIRYFILHRFGGMYVDLDFMCCKPLTPLLEGQACVVGREPVQHCRHHRVTNLLCNALMSAVPGHAFFEDVIQRLPEFIGHVENKEPILSSTGPIMMSRVFEDFAAPDSVTVVPSRYLYPLTLHQAAQYRLAGCTGVDLSSAFAIHLFYGTWWKTDAWDRKWRGYYKAKSLLQQCGRSLWRRSSA